MDNVEWLWHWIRTRENVRILKDSGTLGPWCNDPIITNNHFCNVRREDDRGTRDIRRVVQDSGIGTLELPWVYTLARMFNHAGTTALALRAWLEGADWPTAVKWHRDRGNKIFHTAYVVSTCGESIDKVDYVGRVVGAVRNLRVPQTSLQAAFDTLTGVDGIGSFMAGQILADLKNDRFLSGAEDWFTWASMGPGSKKGMDYIYGGGTTHSNFPYRMVRLRGMMPSDIKAMNIHAQDLQNCLCEYSKYMALKEGTRGRSRPYHG